MSKAKIEFLVEQTAWVDQWTDNLVVELNEEDCLIQDDLGTSINWQIGHLIISKYFHTIQCVLHHDHAIIKHCQQNIPLKDMMAYYFAGSNPFAVWTARPSKTTLMTYKEIVDQATAKVMANLSPSDLDQQTEFSNPIAKNKYEALTFSFKHQMWHNGQIALIKRIIGYQV